MDYGMSTGDEGWRFVDPVVAEERLGEGWSTRVFTEVRTAGDGVIMYNAKGQNYVESQDKFVKTFFGGEKPYFALDARITGLDHGVLSALERVTVRKARSTHRLESVRVEQLTKSKERKGF